MEAPRTLRGLIEASATAEAEHRINDADSEAIQEIIKSEAERRNITRDEAALVRLRLSDEARRKVSEIFTRIPDRTE